jgi:glycosyltransferase involved in cell wall biosynthesis
MKKRTKLLHLTPLAAYGGCEVNCLRLIQARGDCDHHVVVFDRRGPITAEWERAGASVQHLGEWQRDAARFVIALAAWSKWESRPDAVIYWSTSRLPSVLGVIGRWEAPCVVHLGNPLGAGLISRARRQVDDWAHRAHPNVTLVACSNYVAESHHGSAYFRKFPIQVIYNPVEPALDRDRDHRDLCSGRAPRVGMVARLDRIKDHRTLIRALAVAAAARTDIEIEFAGDGPLRAELQREAARLGVGGRVRFLGFAPVGPLLLDWDIYAHSTTDSEGMGTAVAEAMTSGLPCLVSDLRVMREVCGEDGAAYARAGDDASFSRGLLQLADDLPRRKSLGRTAQERARKMFGLNAIASAYLKVLFPRAAPTIP